MPADRDDPTHRHGNDPDDLIAWRLAQGPIDLARAFTCPTCGTIAVPGHYPQHTHGTE